MFSFAYNSWLLLEKVLCRPHLQRGLGDCKMEIGVCILMDAQGLKW